MSKIKIATCQFPLSADINANKNYILKFIEKAALQKVRLIHFSETALSGYGGSEWEDYLKFDWLKLKEATQEIMTLCKKKKIWCALGSSHPLSGKNLPHNSIFVINDQGKIVTRYDKRFCTGNDLKYYTSGDHFSTFTIDGVKFGLLICYDVRFPELYREYLKLGVNCMLHSFYNADRKKPAIHDIIMHPSLQAHAATNSMFVVANNNSKSHQAWPSIVITPDGKIRKKLQRNKPGMIVDTIDLSEKFYDAGGSNKFSIMKGKLNSGKLVKDLRSKKLTIL